jgi:hypothetical protein
MPSIERPRGFGWVVAVVSALALMGCGAREVRPACLEDGACPPDAAGPACEEPQALCDGRCVSTADDPEHCGGCGQRCPADPGRVATCEIGVCGWECNPGFERVGESCEPRALRPIAPLSTATVTSQQPTLRWQLPSGAEGARVEICRDRAFTVQCQTIDAAGTSGRPARALERGVWFWRLRARSGGNLDVVPSAVWQFRVGARSAPVDTSHGSTLDVNGDGFADLAVRDGAVTNAPTRTRLYLGSAAGPSGTPSLTLDGPDSGLRTFYGRLVGVGDVNGDGYADLAQGAEEPSGGVGWVYVYFGSATGPRATPSLTLREPEGSIASFGLRVAGVGDVNGDGYADLAVAGRTDAGQRLYVYLGSATGPRPTPAFSLTGDPRSLAGFADFNGDGYADLAAQAAGPSAGTSQVNVYFGSATGLSATPSLSLQDPEGNGTFFGNSLASGGDLNGDGYADLVVQAERLHVYFGSASGPSARPAVSIANTEGSGSGFGWVLASAGDLNGDGYADLVVGADGALSFTGRVHVYFGSETGPSVTPSVSITGPDGSASYFGGAIASGGDLDGDGYGDLSVGAFGASRVHVYFGGAPGPGPSPSLSLTGPDAPSGSFGISVARAGGVRRAPARTRTPALMCRELPTT